MAPVARRSGAATPRSQRETVVGGKAEFPGDVVLGEANLEAIGPELVDKIVAGGEDEMRQIQPCGVINVDFTPCGRVNDQSPRFRPPAMSATFELS